jgi:hypothetical protein
MKSPPDTLDPVTVLAALANVNRWQLVAQMAAGAELTLNAVAQATGRGYKAVVKDFNVLYESGAVAVRYGQDGRVGIFFIPEKYRLVPGVVDYGFCAVRFGDAAKLVEKIPKD